MYKAKENKRVSFETRILFWGIQRSGNHGIINWVLEQFDDSKIFINDQKFGEKVDHEKVKLAWEKVKSRDSQRLLLVSFENYDISLLNQEKYLQGCKNLDESLFGESLDTINIIILRDPFNMWVSNRPPKNEPQDPGLWKTYAREFLDETNFLPRKICINFDKWFLDADYRKSISDLLGVTFSDKGLNKVSSHGGGSNFDKTNFDGKAQKMRVLNRWNQSRNFLKKRRLIKILRKDKEMSRLTKTIYRDMYEDWNITTLFNFWYHWF